jgi:hypothetical protein
LADTGPDQLRRYVFGFIGSVVISEHESVLLVEDLPEKGLSRGALGAVVMVHGLGEAYEVEFLSPAGDTVAVLTLRPNQVQPCPAEPAGSLVHHVSRSIVGS